MFVLTNGNERCIIIEKTYCKSIFAEKTVIGGKSEMKKVSFRLFAAMLFAVLFLASCGCEHEWQPADCMNPAICKKCGAAHGEPDAGKHEAVKDAAVAPTCTADGKAEGEHCSRCGKVLVPQEKIPAAGHEPVNFEAVQPTCAAEGRSAGSECAKCGAVLEGGETIAKLPHTEVVDPAVAATCSSTGLTEGKHCSVCGATVVAQEKTPLKEHIEVVDKGYPATIKAPGKTEGSHCSVCNAVIKERQTLDTVSMTPDLFDKLIAGQALAVTSTKYVVQNARFKSLYPDMLQAILKNNTASDIKDAVVAFVAWDKNNLPVKIKSHLSYRDEAYVQLVNSSDMNLVPRASYGRKKGYAIDEDCNIKKFKAIVVSYETFDGETWMNPYYYEWRTLYEGKRFDSGMSIDVRMIYGG